MNDDDDLVEAKAALVKAIAEMPADLRAALPTNAEGQPQAEIVHALYRYEGLQPGEVRWIEVRELSIKEWDAAIAAHRDVYRFTRGLDGFPSFAWGDLRNVRHELLRQLREQTLPDEWLAPLVEYRILNYSTALKLYHEHVTAQVNRTGDDDLTARVTDAFSELYDRSFGYRLIYSMRNAFQHGVRGLVSLRMTARLVAGSDTERESEAHANLEKVAFAASRGNAAVRQQVRETDETLTCSSSAKKRSRKFRCSTPAWPRYSTPKRLLQPSCSFSTSRRLAGSDRTSTSTSGDFQRRGFSARRPWTVGGSTTSLNRWASERSTRKGRRSVRWRFCPPTHRPVTDRDRGLLRRASCRLNPP